MIKLDKHKFREYLNALDRHAVVGRTGNPEKCPLAWYLEFKERKLGNIASFHVQPKLITWIRHCHSVGDMPTPIWAKEFVIECDRSSPGVIGQPVEARECIDFLNFVEHKIRHDKVAMAGG